MNTEHNLSGMKWTEDDGLDLAVSSGFLLVGWLFCAAMWRMGDFERFLPSVYVAAFFAMPAPFLFGATREFRLLHVVSAYVFCVPGMFSVFRLTDDIAWRMVLCVFAPAIMLLVGRLCFMVRERSKLKRQ